MRNRKLISSGNLLLEQSVVITMGKKSHRDVSRRDQQKANVEQSADTINYTGQDELNRQIIKFLQDDGRASYATIASKLGVSEGTVRNRIIQLQNGGLLRVVAVADPITMGYEANAMLGITVAAGMTPQTVAERLGRHREVVYVMWVSGPYDLLAEVIFDTKNDFLRFLSEEIHSRDDIADFDTMINLGMFKNLYFLKPDLS
jgi:Lrp/AsnC family transcriptional regulator, regulator for asnA, asnC and gidA